MRHILREKDGERVPLPPCNAATLARLEQAFRRARGNGVRVQELLASESGLNVPYSTLTRWIREAQLRDPPKRSGEYHQVAGEEMQYDTSPHRVLLSGKAIAAQCAALTLAYSRRLFFQYYPRFTRFEAKQILLEGVRFNDGSCPLCIIDNTSVIVVAGSGPDAVFAPEMVAFARSLGFEFRAHRVNHPDRKSRIERPFAWIERNFLPGRSFIDFDDLNRQALTWCCEVANQKVKRVLGMSPEAAYALEKPSLTPLPRVLPPVYEVLERVVDLYGYVSVDTNRYSAPERLVRQAVSVHKHPGEIVIYHRGGVVARHPRLIGKRDARHTLPGHHVTPTRADRGPALEEQLLRGDHPNLERYAAALKQRGYGRATRGLRRLLELKRTYPAAPFLAAIEEALRFGLFDLQRLERLILKHVAGDFFNLGEDDNA